MRLIRRPLARFLHVIGVFMPKGAESLLNSKKKTMEKPKCKNCHYYKFSITLGSPDTPIWHCRYGFTPFCHTWGKCTDMAKYNYDLEENNQLTLL